MWAEVAKAKYGEKQKIKPPRGVKPEPKMETVALATEPDKPYCFADMVNDLDSAFESFNDLAAKTDEVIDSVDKAYDEDGANELSEDELRTAVLNGTVSTGIADAGASASCGKPTLSNCGRFTMAKDPFISTGRKSDKIFLMALGNIAPADEIKYLPFSIRQPARDVNMVPEIKHNLLSMNQFHQRTRS